MMSGGCQLVKGEKGLWEKEHLHHACNSPGRKPNMQRQMLIRESAEQIPHLTQTAIGGKRMARSPRKISVEHIVMGCMVLQFCGLKKSLVCAFPRGQMMQERV
jgi:hypothetical protein